MGPKKINVIFKLSTGSLRAVDKRTGIIELGPNIQKHWLEMTDNISKVTLFGLLLCVKKMLN